MGNTKIEWATKVFNPISGCCKISNGCRNCYAERMSKRLAGRYGYPKDNPFRVTLHPEKLMEPLKWKKPQRIFVCSMSDWMHDDVPIDFIDEMIDVVSACPQHTFLTLTKRPENLERKIYDATSEHGCRKLGGGDWLPNLWFGVSVEDQKSADERIPLLLRFSPVAKRLVSVEPMLGLVDLEKAGCEFGCLCGVEKLSWVICGSETGPHAHPMDLNWARSLRDQCSGAGIPFFLKQISINGKVSHDINEWPEDLRIREMP